MLKLSTRFHSLSQTRISRTSWSGFTALRILALMIFIIGAFACTDPESYNEKDISDNNDTSVFDISDTSKKDIKSDTEISDTKKSDSDAKDVKKSDADKVDPKDEQETEICEPVEISDCDIEFSYPATSPVAQSYVWITGSFCGWATTLEGGAIEMTLNAITNTWEGVVHADTGVVIEYKYLLGWPDNPGPEWWNQDGNNAPDAPNSIKTVDCGMSEDCLPDHCKNMQQDGDEEGVDCGGSCPKICPEVPACDDGVMNGDEEGVDCGGTCPDVCPEATCDDNLMNGDEEGVDCGGSCPDDCAFDWHDAILYFVFTDRFNDGDESNNTPIGAPEVEWPADFQGGDLQGVIDKLDYLEELGINAVWLTAPYKNRSISGKGIADSHNYSGYHGYWPSPNDVGGAMEIDPHWGTPEVLKELVDKAHARNMKVLLDYVMNHIDAASPLYQNHKDWFHPTMLCGKDEGRHLDMRQLVAEVHVPAQ